MSKDHRNQSRLKRGGGEPVLSLDLHREDGTVLLDPVSDVTPESLFDRQWVLTVLHQAADQLAEQYRLRGQPSLLEALRFVISPELDPEPYRSIGERENMSEAAVRVAAHRLKIRYQEALRQIISETLEEGADVEEEMRELRAVFA
jgi:RNA polymerase sigma-70 factor (ECF subfamily)